MIDEEEGADREDHPVMRVGVVRCRRRIVPELKTIDKVRDAHPEFFSLVREWLDSQSSWTREKLQVKDTIHNPVMQRPLVMQQCEESFFPGPSFPPSAVILIMMALLHIILRHANS